VDIAYIRKNGMPVEEIVQKIGLPEVTIRKRIYARGIQPIGYIGKHGFYAEADFDKIAQDGSRVPKTRNGKPFHKKDPEKEASI
jgi:hypothetical protein